MTSMPEGDALSTSLVDEIERTVMAHIKTNKFRRAKAMVDFRQGDRDAREIKSAR
jgi:hypothetical protein